MERLKILLEEIRLIEEAYDLECAEIKQHISKLIVNEIQEILINKDSFEIVDFEIIKCLNISKFKELGFLKLSHARIADMRELADIFGYVIIPISYSKCGAQNQEMQKIANDLGMYTFALTPLENYDMWNEVVSHQDVGEKYFPIKEYGQVLLTIELIMGTQKNLFEMAKENERKIKRLSNSYKENMSKVQEVLRKLSKNQKKLKAEVDCLFDRFIAPRLEDYISFTDIVKLDDDIRDREAPIIYDIGEKKFYPTEYYKYTDTCEFHPKTVKYINKVLADYRASKIGANKLKNTFKLEDIDIEKIILDEFQLESDIQFVKECRRILPESDSLIFHTFVKNPAEEDGIIFLNT